MKFKVEITQDFKKDSKRLLKKYSSLRNELELLKDILVDNPFQGASIGHNCFKIRLAIASKSKGKSGGARIITHVKIIGATVYLLTIYDKSEFDSTSDVDITNLLKQLPE